MAITKLTWDNDSNCYTAPVEGGTLFVSGDDYAEEKCDMARSYLLEKHPEIERGGPFDAYVESHEQEWEECVDKAEDELNDADIWAMHAVTLKPGQDISDVDGHFAAWIESK